MADEKLPTHADFVRCTLNTHAKFHLLPLAVRFEYARVMANGLANDSDYYRNWKDAVHACLNAHGGDRKSVV